MDLEHGLLIFRVLNAGVGQIDDTAHHEIAVVPEQQDVRPTNNHPPFDPALRLLFQKVHIAFLRHNNANALFRHLKELIRTRDEDGRTTGFIHHCGRIARNTRLSVLPIPSHLITQSAQFHLRGKVKVAYKLCLLPGTTRFSVMLSTERQTSGTKRLICANLLLLIDFLMPLSASRAVVLCRF